MFFLLVFVLLIQFFNYWIFAPLSVFFNNLFEVKYIPIIALLVVFFLFAARDKNQ